MDFQLFYSQNSQESVREKKPASANLALVGYFRQSSWQIVFNVGSSEKVFCYQNCSCDREKVLKFEAEGREFAKFLR